MKQITLKNEEDLLKLIVAYNDAHKAYTLHNGIQYMQTGKRSNNCKKSNDLTSTEAQHLL